MNAQLKSNAIQIDAPIEGWDAFHSLDNMPPTAAIVLDNIIPYAGSVKSREGYITYTDLGTDAPVETVASFNASDNSALVAASAGGIWDITNSALGEPAQFVNELAPPGTFNNNRWQTENFRKADEKGIMVMCNGNDPAQVFGDAGDTGTNTLTPLIDTEGVGTDFIGALSFKGRMYYWKDNDNAFYYSQAGSYQGELKKFDLGSFTQRGGKLVIAASWTQQDSGDGKDDFIVFIFSTGEVLIYQGDDPETAGYWEFVGRYFMAEPLSIRGQTNYGADLIIMTRDGYVNLASIVQQGRTSDVPQFSRLIHNAINNITDFQPNLFFGWCVELFAKKGLMVFNAPLSNQTYEQHVMSTITQRWCRFTGLNVICLEIHDERMFAGANDGTVKALLETTSDDGNPINYTCLYAFQYLDAPGHNKMVTSAQVISTHSNPQFIQISGYADYQIPTLLPVQHPVAGDQATWSPMPAVPPEPEGSYWNEDYWAVQNSKFTTKGWQNCSAFGYAVSVLVRFALKYETIEWRSTGLRYHVAGAH